MACRMGVAGDECGTMQAVIKRSCLVTYYLITLSDEGGDRDSRKRAPK